MTQSPMLQYPVIITNVEPSVPLIEASLRSVKAIQINIVSITPAFRWPVVGEAWLVTNRNGSWYLDSVLPDANAYTLWTNSNPGDMILNTTTGVVSVMGEEATADTNVDFSIYYSPENNSMMYKHNGTAYAFGTGPTGERGSMWFDYKGTGTPSGLSGVAEGDFCLRSDGEIFEYLLSGSGDDAVLVWTDTGINIQGPTGATGATGPKGEPGAITDLSGDISLSDDDSVTVNQSSASTFAVQNNMTVGGTATFSDSPQVPTAAAGDNTENAASTAFVSTALAGGFSAADRLLTLVSDNPALLGAAEGNVGAMLDNLCQIDGLASTPALVACATQVEVLASTAACTAITASPLAISFLPQAYLVAYPPGTPLFGGYVAGMIDTTQGNIIAADVFQKGEKYLLIVSPASSEVQAVYKSSAGAVAAAETRWNGLGATAALVAIGNTAAAIACNNLSYPSDGGSQWYLPAIDELEILYRNFKPTTDTNDAPAAWGGSTGEFPPTSQTSGANPSSFPVGSAYTSSSPVQTTVAAFKSSSGAQYLGYSGATIFWSSTYGGEIGTTFEALAQTFVGSFNSAGNQGTNVQTTNCGVRPVRRVVIG